MVSKSQKLKIFTVLILQFTTVAQIMKYVFSWLLDLSGIGFNLNRPDAEKTFKKVVPGVDFNKVKSGKQTITDKQARALFNHDVDKIYEPRARNRVGKDVYDKLPSNVKAAVVNAVYRGDLGPKTTNLIKQGKWKEVGKEYLDHDQYRNADTLGISGVKKRMDWNKEQFDTMIKQEKPK